MDKVLTGRDLTVLIDGEPLGGVTELTVKETVKLEPIETFLTDVPVAVLKRPRWDITLTLESRRAAPFEREYISELTVTDGGRATVYEGCTRSGATEKAAPDGAVAHAVTLTAYKRRLTDAGNRTKRIL